MSISEHYITDREFLEEQEYSYKWEQQEIGGVLMPALILTTPSFPGEPIVVGRKYVHIVIIKLTKIKKSDII